MIPKKVILVGSLLLLCVPTNTQGDQQDKIIHDKEISATRVEDLKYPQLAFQTRSEGIVVVLAKLDNDGNVVDAEVLSGPDFLISDSLNNVKKWKFQPNNHNAVIIVYNFRMRYAKNCKPGTISSKLTPPNLVNVTACPMTVQP
jgi:TonB family protein